MDSATQAASQNTSAPDWFHAGLHWISLGIEVLGIAAIVLGGLAAMLIFAMRLGRGNVDLGGAYHDLRTSLARSILLGLEFLVAADIIGTVAVQPSLDNLSVLGLIVLIRTFLSFSLEVEIDGRWPWHKGKDEVGKIKSSEHGGD